MTAPTQAGEAAKEPAGAKVADKVDLLPDQPGVYLMKDARGQIIYVGKAGSLHHRVKSYFRSPGQLDPKTQVLVRHIADLDYIVTDSEIEALVLECNLIKKYRPRYNVSLRDDKNYPYLRLSIQDEFPRLSVTRSIGKDGARYFGPFVDAGAMHETMKLIQRLFPLRTCSDRSFANRSRPCLYQHIGRCTAPCAGQISREEYGEMVRGVIDFLEGRGEELVPQLEAKMRQAAARMEFEKAAVYRDQVEAIKKVVAKQKMAQANQEDLDVVAIARGFNQACGQVFFMRDGKVVGREHFLLSGTDQLSREEIITAFVKQFYSGLPSVPRRILLQEPLVEAEQEVVARWLAEKAGHKVELVVPKRGPKRELVEMVHRNALLILEERQARIQSRRQMAVEALAELQRVLGLPEPPLRIEGYDISNLQGTSMVGSMVVFEGGQPQAGEYRRFRLKGVETQDDFACLAEIVGRRFHRYRAGDDKFARLPDLVLIDGGRGQLSAARQAMREAGVDSIPMVALAKGEELLFREGDPLPLRLPRDSVALRLLQYVRDEAHRFAITYHRQLRQKGSRGSVLDAIPGIGSRRKKALLAQFGSVSSLREATVEQLAQVPGMTRPVAQRLYDYLHSGQRQ
ncbi:MAG: excinuclease ABC subunit UvrC [Clostridia bacterium]|nr:excinuclease ABC subunit UvrC [Clostridia bacterium]